MAILDHARGSQPADQRDGELRPGDRVVFTGDMSMPRAKLEDLAASAGLLVSSAVSGKTALVVTADPYSQSGKAKRCRELGVRMVTEQVFLHLIDGIQVRSAT
jgi:DNA polymerase-3 subunit epsilon